MALSVFRLFSRTTSFRWAAWIATAVDLLQFVPTPANNGSALVTAPVQPDRGDQFTVKIDHRINDKQNLSVYYYFDDHHVVSPFAQFQAAGANVPGFASTTNERFQQWNISHTWTISNTTVNEFRFNYNREAQRTFQHPRAHQSACRIPARPRLRGSPTYSGPCLASRTARQTMPWAFIPALVPSREGLPFIQVSGGFTIGNNGEGELPQVGNSFQWSDSVSKVVGNALRSSLVATFAASALTRLSISTSTANSLLTALRPIAPVGDTVFSDYLLGFPGSYGQGSAQVENVRSTGLYLFAQDSWKIKPNLTLNYGLRWELNTPIADISKHVQTFRPGQVEHGLIPARTAANTDCSSMTPVGLVVPGDPGVSDWSDADVLQGLCSANRHCLESRDLRQDQHPRRMGTLLQPD